MFTFGSRYPGFILTLDPGGPKYNEKMGTFIPKTPYKGVTFNEGVFTTNDEDLAETLRKRPEFGRDFWEISKPEDATRVNQGRRLEMGTGAKSTTGMASVRK